MPYNWDISQVKPMDPFSQQVGQGFIDAGKTINRGLEEAQIMPVEIAQLQAQQAQKMYEENLARAKLELDAKKSEAQLGEQKKANKLAEARLALSERGAERGQQDSKLREAKVKLSVAQDFNNILDKDFKNDIAAIDKLESSLKIGNLDSALSDTVIGNAVIRGPGDEKGPLSDSDVRRLGIGYFGGTVQGFLNQVTGDARSKMSPEQKAAAIEILKYASQNKKEMLKNRVLQAAEGHVSRGGEFAYDGDGKLAPYINKSLSRYGLQVDLDPEGRIIEKNQKQVASNDSKMPTAFTSNQHKAISEQLPVIDKSVPGHIFDKINPSKKEKLMSLINQGHKFKYQDLVNKGYFDLPIDGSLNKKAVAEQ